MYQSVGKYARGAVMYAFQDMGGPDTLAKWAKDNKSDFYTKLFPKIIARESEVQHVRGVDDLMDLLDGDYEVVEDNITTPEPEIIDMEPVDTAMERNDIVAWTSEPEDIRVDLSAFDDDFDVDDFVEFDYE